MQITTLSDLTVAYNECQGKLISSTESLVSSTIQQQLKQLIKQKHLGLPIDHFLKANPIMLNWIEELEQAFPALFKPKKKLILDHNINRRLILKNHPSRLIETSVNVGINKGKVKLFEWAVRYPAISWQEEIKLWAASSYFNTKPSNLKLIIFAFHPERPLEKEIVQWNIESEERTEQKLVELLTNSAPKVPKRQIPEFDELLDIEGIEEVPL